MKLNVRNIKKINYSVDEIGTIYFFENKVLRAIKEEYKSYIVDLLSSGLIDELVKNNLFPKTWISSYEIEGYSIILEHEKLSNWNYSHEWSFDMLKDVALMVIEVNNISNKYGYELFDCHRSNAIFNYNCPIYVDLGSFKKTNNTNVWIAKDIFYKSYYIPLKLYSNGYSKSARNILLSVEYFDKTEFRRINNPIIGLVGYRALKKIEFIQKVFDWVFVTDINIIKERLKNRSSIYTLIAKFIKKYFYFLSFNSDVAKELIDNLKNYKLNSMWENYHDEVDANESKRFNRVAEIINSFDNVNSIMEFAANQGKLSSYLLDYSVIQKAIVTDYDINAVNTMYLNNKDRDNFLPLLIDFVKPEGRRFDNSIEERFSADITIALAVTHHLLLTQKYDISYIFEVISKFTNKYILIEFMPIGLFGGDMENTPKTPEFYTVEWFKENFLKYFDYILDEELEYNRHLFVGKRKNK